MGVKDSSKDSIVVSELGVFDDYKVLLVVS